MLYNVHMTFKENAKEIASYLFNTKKEKEDIDSCDLVVCLYSVKDERYIGVIQLGYKEHVNHSIELLDDKFNISMIKNDSSLNNSKPKLAALVGDKGLNDE